MREGSDGMRNKAILKLRKQLQMRYDAALEEVADAILVEIARGKQPRRAGAPQVSFRKSGMPSISDAPIFGGNGHVEYDKLLEPLYDDWEARQKGTFPAERFPLVAALKAYINEHPDISPAFDEGLPTELASIVIDLNLTRAANGYFAKYGEVASTVQNRGFILRPLFVAMFSDTLRISVAIPIVFTGFDFDHLRLSPNASIIRMSEAMQQARWAGKA